MAIPFDGKIGASGVETWVRSWIGGVGKRWLGEVDLCGVKIMVESNNGGFGCGCS